MIDFRRVSVKRGDKLALDNLDLRIEAGEHAAILGPNGCGKSTLIKTITRECYPLAREESSLTILDRKIWNIFDLRSHLGIVSNDMPDNGSTGIEIVLSGFFSSIGIWPHQRITAGMEEKARLLLDRLEVAHLGERFISAMSSGEARRILIGRALAHDPAALILDEPTNSLDIHAMHSLRDTMRKLAQTGTSIILVTHHLPDIIPEIERVVLMADGRVWRDGPKQELLRPEALSELFQTRLEVVERDGYFQMW